MDKILTWLADPLNIETLVSTWAIAIAAAQMVVRFTPNDLDDQVVAKLVGFRIGEFAEKLRNMLTFKRPTGPSDDVVR